MYVWRVLPYNYVVSFSDIVLLAFRSPLCTGCSVSNATLLHTNHFTEKCGTGGNVEFFQPRLVVAVDALLEMGMGEQWPRNQGDFDLSVIWATDVDLLF